MALSDILLRTLSHPTLIAKGSALTWPEEDTNFVELYEAVFGVTDFTNSGVAAYDGGTTYSEDDIVAYNGFLYTYINPVDSSGNAPPNPTYWELTGGASLAHVQNKDQYLDFGGAYQVSAQEIREFIDSPLDISTKWDITGNTLASRGTFGSTSGAYGWDFKVNNSVYGGVANDGKWFWGTNAAFTDTYFSIKSSSNLGTFNALAIKDSDNATIFEFKSTGNVKTPGGFLNASDNTVCNFYASNLYRENSGPKVVVDWANTLLKNNDASDRLNWHFSWLLTGVTVDLDWGNHRLEGSWRAIENFAIGQTPSYGGGTGVIFIANAGTIPSTDPVDGFILYVDPADDKLKARGNTGTITILALP